MSEIFPPFVIYWVFTWNTRSTLFSSFSPFIHRWFHSCKICLENMKKTWIRKIHNIWKRKLLHICISFIFSSYKRMYRKGSIIEKRGKLKIRTPVKLIYLSLFFLNNDKGNWVFVDKFTKKDKCNIRFQYLCGLSSELDRSVVFNSQWHSVGSFNNKSIYFDIVVQFVVDTARNWTLDPCKHYAGGGHGFFWTARDSPIEVHQSIKYYNLW